MYVPRRKQKNRIKLKKLQVTQKILKTEKQ